MEWIDVHGDHCEREGRQWIGYLFANSLGQGTSKWCYVIWQELIAMSTTWF